MSICELVKWLVDKNFKLKVICENNDLVTDVEKIEYHFVKGNIYVTIYKVFGRPAQAIFSYKRERIDKEIDLRFIASIHNIAEIHPTMIYHGDSPPVIRYNSEVTQFIFDGETAEVSRFEKFSAFEDIKEIHI